MTVLWDKFFHQLVCQFSQYFLSYVALDKEHYVSDWSWRHPLLLPNTAPSSTIFKYDPWASSFSITWDLLFWPLPRLV